MGQQLHDEVGECLRGLWYQLGQSRGGSPGNRGQNRYHRLSFKWQPPREQLVENHAEPEEVALCINLLDADPLWRHVGRRAHDRTVHCQPGLGGLQFTGQTKVDDSHPPARPLEQNIVWLDVPVHQSVFMSSRQTLGKFAANPDGFGGRDCLASSDSIVGQIRSIDMLHNDVGQPIVLSHLIDGDNMGMIDRCSGLAFTQKSLARDGICRPAGVHQLDGDLPFKPSIAAEIDPPHAAMADQALNRKATDRLRQLTDWTVNKRVGRLPATRLYGLLFATVGVERDRLGKR